MRFAVTGEWRRNGALRLAIGAYLLFALGQLATGTLLYLQAMSLDPASVVAHYQGDEARFLQPRTLQGMLEVTHMHMLGMGLQLLTLGHLVFFTRLPRTAQVGLVAAAFAAALGSEAAGWAVWAGASAAAPLKVAAFMAVVATQLAMVAAVAVELVLPGPGPVSGALSSPAASRP